MKVDYVFDAIVVIHRCDVPTNGDVAVVARRGRQAAREVGGRFVHLLAQFRIELLARLKA